MIKKNVFPLPAMADLPNKEMPIQQPKIMVSIVERGKGKAIIQLYNKEGVNFHYQTIGHGTATSEIMDILGLDSKDKDVIISISTTTMIERLIYKMSDELRGVIDTRGILFDFPVTGMTNLLAGSLNMKLGISQEIREELARNDLSENEINDEEKEENDENQDKNNKGKGVKGMSSDKNYSLILISVNQGYTETVLDTARKLGARGGTVIRARWSGNKAFEQHGVNLQDEKEIIAIVVPNSIRNKIMDEVNSSYGAKTKTQAVVISMKVDNFAPI